LEHVYLGRQPVIDLHENLFAYEILYRDGDKTNTITDDRYASAAVINNVLNKFGTQSLLGNRKAFVKIDQKFLMNDIIFSIPKDFFIFSLFDSVEINAKTIERVQQLFEKKYTLSINDTSLTLAHLQKYKPIFKELSYFKVNFQESIDAQTKELIGELKKNGIKVVGTHIEDSVYYSLAKQNGCDLFQGYFLAKPNIVQNAKYDSSQFNILRLYNLLMNDTNIDEITKEFENNHALTIQLLQFINSGYFSFKNKISTIHHVLTLMGRTQLSQWLMLMVYSKSVSKSDGVSPLMLMAKNRTELMQKVLKMIHPDAKSNAMGEAYFVGMLSLIDALFGIELSQILETMHISEGIKEALLKHKGLLGEIYLFVQAIESFNTEAIESFITKYKLDHEMVRTSILQSIESVNSFEDSLKALK